MADRDPILVTGAAGRLGAVRRTVCGLLLDRGLPVRAWCAAKTTGQQHRAGHHDRLADGVERVTGRPSISARECVSLHADEFGGRA